MPGLGLLLRTYEVDGKAGSAVERHGSRLMLRVLLATLTSPRILEEEGGGEESFILDVTQPLSYHHSLSPFLMSSNRTARSSIPQSPHPFPLLSFLQSFFISFLLPFILSPFLYHYIPSLPSLLLPLLSFSSFTFSSFPPPYSYVFLWIVFSPFPTAPPCH